MKTDAATSFVETWHIHNEINLILLRSIPAKRFAAVPTGSRGRTVGEQFVHTVRVRTGWLHYHQTGKRPSSASIADLSPKRSELVRAFKASGKAVELHLAESFRGEKRIRAFQGQPDRWMGYLIAHESHHRGSIMLALKQNGIRLPEKVSLQGLWATWMWGPKEGHGKR